jgi:hypothetical protein
MDGVPPGDNDLVGCIGCLNKNLKIFDFSTVKKLKIVLKLDARSRSWKQQTINNF